MPSINELIRRSKAKMTGEQKIENLAVLFTLLVVCDWYVLEKKDGVLKLSVYKNLFKTQLSAKTEFELAIPLGEWLARLPKGVWNEI